MEWLCTLTQLLTQQVSSADSFRQTTPAYGDFAENRVMFRPWLLPLMTQSSYEVIAGLQL